MRRAAELAAQVFTARDALLRDTAEDLRVAFLLFDSAVETLLVRRVQSDMRLGRWDRGRFALWRGDSPIEIDLNDYEQKERVEAASTDQFVHWQLSKSQKRKIEREFESKLKLLAWEGVLPAPYVSVIGRLHEYRNEMYHREESRPDALRIVVHLYAWIIADLLERLGPGWFSHYSGDPDDLLERTYRRMGRDSPRIQGIMFDGLSMQSDMAEALREGLDLATASDLLADYISSRLEALHESIDFCIDFISATKGFEGMRRADLVRVIYSDEPSGSIEQLRRHKPRIREAQFARWDQWPGRIKHLSEPIDAFLSLAEFEAEFEEFENRVQELTFAIDREIQLQTDIARGK